MLCSALQTLSAAHKAHSKHGASAIKPDHHGIAVRVSSWLVACHKPGSIEILEHQGPGLDGLAGWPGGILLKAALSPFICLPRGLVVEFCH